jgi:hypothetical protein
MADKRPPAPTRGDTEYSSDPGPEPEPEQELNVRSRSQSRRRRRQKQQKAHQLSAQAGALTSVREEDGQPQARTGAQANAQSTMFDYIGGDETSMDGPVTHARAMRGEIPMRSGNQSLQTVQKAGEKGIGDEEGLKLKLELNIDVEIELKASLRGDLTLALL